MAIHLITAMNALSILAMAMVIYLFGGYLDAAEVHPTTTVGGAAVNSSHLQPGSAARERLGMNRMQKSPEISQVSPRRRLAQFVSFTRSGRPKE
jgi:hypothetical protein